ncbi:aminomethyl-transferring glycine dehydrogenase [Halobacteriales archaeon QS_4_62_28]|nr:MAG: aminomethyl-transferring glycine dehydrogenase [Halobacteriales archaeon QS_4_62_28]
MSDNHSRGSPYAPHTEAMTMAMLDAVDAESEAALFDIPDTVTFDGKFDIPERSERATRRHVEGILGRNDDLTAFMGRGHYDHYVPSVVEDLAGRSEFLTSYTQYQPEVAQGFLQALFEYQSMLVALTGLDVANCSMYDGATALGEAVTLSQRVRSISGDRVLVPDLLRDGKREVLENYAAGPGVIVDTYSTADGNVDTAALEETFDDDVAMVYAENPTVRGTIEEHLSAVGDLADAHDALFCLGSDPVALALLEAPASVGTDIVVGDASSLGIGTAYGFGLGLFVTREEYLRQVPGRLVGAATDESDRRTYTLTLQTREQHIRRERATSNICTNQAWVALRTAIHAVWLGPDGLLDLAESCVTRATDLAARVDEIRGVKAPVHDRHHFREFVAHTDQPAGAVRAGLADNGYGVHAVGDHEIQICVTETTERAVEEFIETLAEVAV